MEGDEEPGKDAMRLPRLRRFVPGRLGAPPAGESEAEEWRTQPAQAPDFFTPFVGWRVWLVTAPAGALRLQSLFYPAIWEPRRELIAECHQPRMLHSRRRQHDAPVSRCQCGLYASDLRSVLEYLTTPLWPAEASVDRVVGRVHLWGSVIECERGWRASHAYPAALYVPSPPLGSRRGRSPDEIALGLSDYGVPVEIVHTGSPERLARTLAGA